MTVPPVPIRALLRGRVQAFARGKTSAIDKEEVTEPVEIGPLGLVGDEQADPKHHGGPDKAVHHYPFDHYPDWRTELAEQADGDGSEAIWHAVLEQPGAFGENVSTEGLTERDICVGDLWCAGTALLEVSQARQPCWKLNERFGLGDMAHRVQTTGRTGWYYRVREPGRLVAGVKLTLRGPPACRLAAVAPPPRLLRRPDGPPDAGGNCGPRCAGPVLAGTGAPQA